MLFFLLNIIKEFHGLAFPGLRELTNFPNSCSWQSFKCFPGFGHADWFLGYFCNLYCWHILRLNWSRHSICERYLLDNLISIEIFCTSTIHPYISAPYDMTPYVISQSFYIPVCFIPERAGVFKSPFPVQYVPVCFIPKGKGYIFKLLFPNFFKKKSTETLKD
jgi:hypothetical protein